MCHLLVALLLVSHLSAAEDAPGCVLCSLLWQHGAKRGRNWEESQAARAPLSCLDSVSDGGVQVEDSCEGSAFPLTANLSVTLIWNLQTTFLNDLSSQYAITVKYLYGIINDRCSDVFLRSDNTRSSWCFQFGVFSMHTVMKVAAPPPSSSSPRHWDSSSASGAAGTGVRPILSLGVLGCAVGRH